jgi:hypothetical protein
MTITFPELTEVTGKLNDRRKALADLFAEAKNDKGELDHSKVKGFANGSELAEHVRSLNAEIDDLAKKREDLAEVAKAAKLSEESDNLDPELAAWLAGETSAPAVGGRKQAKSFGDLFVESKAGTELKGTEVELKDFELKTLFETGAGWGPETMRGPKLVDYATRPLRVIDLIPQTTTNQTAIVYMEETTFTNAAAETAEGGTKPEGALALTERSDTVRKIAVWIPVTDEQLEDVPRIRQYLDNRLGFMVRQRLDSQILVGDGTAPNISGILDRSGLQTQAKGADPTPDAVYKAMTKVRVNAFSEPNAAVFHPNDWQDVRLLRTADGVYIWGSPADPGPERIWGLTVVQTTGLTENTGLVGDFQQTELAVKKGVTVEVSNSHSTYFVENKQAVRAEMRAALAVYRPAAFCSVTGI